jgi:hypothetical protein
MTNFKKQIFSVVTAGVMVANIATPAFATTIEISGNGAGADSNVAVQNTNTTTVSQNNTANVTNTVKTNADTGDNKANYNTGGNVGIQTGDAKVNATVANDLNKNIANVDCCGASNTEVKISGNGAKSNNGVGLTNVNATTVAQNNTANVDNNVDVDAETGDNKAGLNTGGDVVIKTGNAKVNVDVSTLANVNSAQVGGGMSATPTPQASFTIVGNGAGSDNEILASMTNATSVAQNNNADIDNEVDVDAETGDNDANFNTGGDVVILTGNSDVEVGVDNSVNFNFADVDCGCEFDVTAKIAGNGADTDHKWWDKDDNYIGLNLANVQAVGQNNGAYLDNNVDVDDAETGDNEAGYNTGSVDHETDPAIVTGNAKSSTSVSNSGNVNSVGSLPFDMPEMPEVDFSFNFAALWAIFGMSN